ncbi:type II toxin-antitoxin system VapC family toxin [Steroidobacter agaridevorans]|uniref:type II toxin-antitoxin system VapC family toxin n=1 Tax=Steroidobacter agaridevorans TaxID=2695856 RepID=UPI00137B2449|nr:type II toxin-antitoxin system VapC family toxin [Steroidobacter agaridevorans]
MRILLDTHLFLWAVSAPSKLSAAARKQIDAAEVFISAASIWEISIKSSIGKLDADPDELLAGVEPAGFSLLPITGDHAAKVARLPPIHKDPFDRLLVAQASVEPMILLTNDDALRDYGSLVTIA